MTKISFPGIGIGEFGLPEVLLSFGENFKIYWSAVFMAIAVIIAAILAFLKLKKLSIKADDMIDLTLFTVIFSVIGARLYYAIGSPKNINGFFGIFAIWNGGLEFYGALIAGAITIFVFSRIKKLPVLKIFDSLSLPIIIAQFIVAIGNFFNTDAIGSQIYDGDALYFIRMGISPHNFDITGDVAFVHPTFLYEAIWLLIGTGVIALFSRKKKFDGQSALIYAAWYGLGRTLIEGFELYAPKLGVFRLTQVVGFFSFIACTLLLIFNLAKAYRKQKDSEEYIPAYKKISRPSSLFEKNDDDDDYTPSFNFSANDNDGEVEKSEDNYAENGDTEE